MFLPVQVLKPLKNAILIVQFDRWNTLQPLSYDFLYSDNLQMSNCYMWKLHNDDRVKHGNRLGTAT